MMDDQLERLYRGMWVAFCKEIPSGCSISNPLLAVVPPEYENSNSRLLIVGQETHGWWGIWGGQSNDDQIGVLRNYYRGFDRGRNHNSPFFNAASKLQKLVNPDSDPFAFMWFNLFVCDEKKRQPTPEIAEKLRKVSVLRDEVNILKPRAVVFFTGPHYDYTIKHKQFFPDAEFSRRSKWWSEVHASGLPTKSARTYHPNYLRREKQSEVVLSEIAAWIKEPQ